MDRVSQQNRNPIDSINGQINILYFGRIGYNLNEIRYFVDGNANSYNGGNDGR